MAQACERTARKPSRDRQGSTNVGRVRKIFISDNLSLVPNFTSSLFRVQAAFEQAQQREDEARKDEADSKKAAAEAARAAEDARAAQRELEAALAVLKVFSNLLKSLNNYSNSIQLGTRRCVCTKDRRTYSKN